MSAQTINTCANLQTRATDKAVLMMLATFCDQSARSRHLVNTIADVTCLSGRTVTAALSRLEACGYITRKFYKGEASEYFVDCDAIKRDVKQRKRGRR